MEFVKNLSYIDICKRLNNRKVHFISDCELFPNFDVIVHVYQINLSKTNEILFETKVLNNTHKHLTIGSNMKNLRFEIL